MSLLPRAAEAMSWPFGICSADTSPLPLTLQGPHILRHESSLLRRLTIWAIASDSPAARHFASPRGLGFWPKGRDRACPDLGSSTASLPPSSNAHAVSAIRSRRRRTRSGRRLGAVSSGSRSGVGTRLIGLSLTSIVPE